MSSKHCGSNSLTADRLKLPTSRGPLYKSLVTCSRCVHIKCPSLRMTLFWRRISLGGCECTRRVWQLGFSSAGQSRPDLALAGAVGAHPSEGARSDGYYNDHCTSRRCCARFSTLYVPSGSGARIHYLLLWLLRVLCLCTTQRDTGAELTFS